MDSLADAFARHHARTQADRSHWDATGQRLCQAQHIRLQVIVVAGEETPCTAKPRLYLVNDQQSSTFTAEPRQPMYILLGSDMHPSFSLHQFDDHCCRLLADCGFRCSEVVVTDMADARDKRLEGFAIMRLPCRRKRAHCATMKAA